MSILHAAEAIVDPPRLWSREEILTKPSPVPRDSGLYGWYIGGLPLPTRGCRVVQGLPLVYIGIAPSRAGSKANLRTRIRQHLRGNASASTLRLSLGCLMSDMLDLHLQPHGTRLHFGEGEGALSAWIAQNARVVWATMSEPWTVEPKVIEELDLPLNLEHNEHHPFHYTLKRLRQQARRRARQGQV